MMVPLNSEPETQGRGGCCRERGASAFCRPGGGGTGRGKGEGETSYMLIFAADLEEVEEVGCCCVDLDEVLVGLGGWVGE